MKTEIIYDGWFDEASLSIDKDEGYFIISLPEKTTEIKLNIADVEKVLKGD